MYTPSSHRSGSCKFTCVPFRWKHHRVSRDAKLVLTAKSRPLPGFTLAGFPVGLQCTYNKWLSTVSSEVWKHAACTVCRVKCHILQQWDIWSETVQTRAGEWNEKNKNRREADRLIDTEWGRDREHPSYHPPWPGREVIAQLPPEPGVTLPLPRHSTLCHAASPTPDSSSWDWW